MPEDVQQLSVVKELRTSGMQGRERRVAFQRLQEVIRPPVRDQAGAHFDAIHVDVEPHVQNLEAFEARA